MARTLTRIVITLPCAMLLALPGVASAQQAKKLSYEQAWAQCKQEISKSVACERKPKYSGAARGRRRLHAQVWVSIEKINVALTQRVFSS